MGIWYFQDPDWPTMMNRLRWQRKDGGGGSGSNWNALAGASFKHAYFITDFFPQQDPEVGQIPRQVFRV